MSYLEWRPYIPVAKRRLQAERELARLRKPGQSVAGSLLPQMVPSL